MLISTDYSSGRLTIRLSGELDHHGSREAMQKAILERRFQ